MRPIRAFRTDSSTGAQTLFIDGLNWADLGRTIQSSASLAAGAVDFYISNENADAMEKQAKQREALARVEAGRANREARLLQGTQRARMAAGGVNLGTGSAKAIQRDTILAGRREGEIIQANAASEADVLRQRADNQRTSGYIGLFSGGVDAVTPWVDIKAKESDAFDKRQDEIADMDPEVPSLLKQRNNGNLSPYMVPRFF